jgi:hypothetical protein
MTLKDQLLLDRSVFLDGDEFGEELSLTLEGSAPALVMVVRADDLTTDRTQGPSQVEGVFARHTVLHYRSDALAARPVEGQRLTIGTGATAERWYVTRVGEVAGMLEVTLERQET